MCKSGNCGGPRSTGRQIVGQVAARTRQIAPVETITVQLGAAVLPVNVLLPMRLLAFHTGRKLFIHLPTVDLPRPIAEWLVLRFPGQVVIVLEETGDKETGDKETGDKETGDKETVTKAKKGKAK